MTIHCSFESPIFGVRVQLESQIVHNMWMRPSITELFVLLAESKLPTNSFSGPPGRLAQTGLRSGSLLLFRKQIAVFLTEILQTPGAARRCSQCSCSPGRDTLI
jgi:hypothetical protein